MIQLDLNTKTQILEYTLQGLKDEEIAHKLNFNITTILYLRSKGVLPKRKNVCGFLVDYPLKELSFILEENTLASISTDQLCFHLNELNITNPQGKTWTRSNVRYYLSQKGINAASGSIATFHLRNIETTPIQNFCEYDPRKLNPYSFLADVTNISVMQTVNTTKRKDLPGVVTFIKQQLEEKVMSYSDITELINKAGYTNKQGKPFGRWSVILLCNKYGICIDRKDVLTLLPKIQEYLNNLPLTQGVSVLEVMAILPKFYEENTLYKGSNDFGIHLQPLVQEHNNRVKEYGLQVMFKQRLQEILDQQTHPVRYEDLGNMLSMSAMQALRYCEAVGVSPTGHYYQCLYECIKSFIAKQPDFSIQELSDYLNTTKYLTQRGLTWEYAHAYIFYAKLQELYPQLPSINGSRNP